MSKTATSTSVKVEQDEPQETEARDETGRWCDARRHRLVYWAMVRLAPAP